VEPYRTKVILMEDRVKALERIVVALEGEVHQNRYQIDHRLATMVTQDRLKGAMELVANQTHN
jgi:hypothetical protein